MLLLGVTGEPVVAAHKTPTLRNRVHKAPYGHFADLEGLLYFHLLRLRFQAPTWRGCHRPDIRVSSSTGC